MKKGENKRGIKEIKIKERNEWNIMGDERRKINM